MRTPKFTLPFDVVKIYCIGVVQTMESLKKYGISNMQINHQMKHAQKRDQTTGWITTQVLLEYRIHKNEI